MQEPEFDDVGVVMDIVTGDRGPCWWAGRRSLGRGRCSARSERAEGVGGREGVGAEGGMGVVAE